MHISVFQADKSHGMISDQNLGKLSFTGRTNKSVPGPRNQIGSGLM